ncbi:reverse transcriptase domain-containing protein, partial [Tanacetum coccineum]
GKLAALNRFLAKSAERSLPFFNTLKNITKENKHEYRYTQEAGEAFQQMKNLITDLPSLTPPQEKETLYAYLAASTEKLELSLIHMTRRLRRYFEAHPVKVITDQPIKNILSNTETSSKLAKYAIELGAYTITFIPRNAVKGQVLVDFLSEVPEGEKEESYFRTPKAFSEKDDMETWTLFTDGALSPKGSGAGLVLIGPSGIEYTYALRLTFPSTNNEAEYEALLAGLRIARQMNISNIEVKVDSKLVASQINGSYEASKDSMIKYLAKAKEYSSGFKSFSIENIPRNMNQKADVLSKLASVAFNHLTKELQANYVIREIHMGSCGMHVGPRAVVRKTIRQRYYWPTMHEDAKKECGMDIHGPLPPTRGGAKFVIVAIDYFTKWIEAKPLVKITGKEVIRFVMDNIICSFGLPQIIVTDNGAQLVNDPFRS